jgi:hypothetical protein
VHQWPGGVDPKRAQPALHPARPLDRRQPVRHREHARPHRLRAHPRSRDALRHRDDPPPDATDDPPRSRHYRSWAPSESRSGSASQHSWTAPTTTSPSPFPGARSSSSCSPRSSSDSPGEYPNLSLGGGSVEGSDAPDELYGCVCPSRFDTGGTRSFLGVRRGPAGAPTRTRGRPGGSVLSGAPPPGTGIGIRASDSGVQVMSRRVDGELWVIAASRRRGEHTVRLHGFPSALTEGVRYPQAGESRCATAP